jgi:hypothetical protein
MHRKRDILGESDNSGEWWSGGGYLVPARLGLEAGDLARLEAWPWVNGPTKLLLAACFADRSVLNIA